MHINQQQFLELLAEASGIDPEKVETQLAELVDEIRQSIEENEAYEIEGFGIFSSLGQHIMFIPSKELETEINYKYVGMEPIELDEPVSAKEEDENPFEDVIDPSVDPDKKNPFAGLIEGVEDEDEEYQPGADKWGVDAHKEDKSANRLFASLMGEQFEESGDDANEPDTVDASEDDLDDLQDIFGDDSDDDGTDDLGAEVSKFMSEDEPPASEKSYKETSFLDDLINEEETEEETIEEIISEEDLLEKEPTLPEEILSDEEEEIADTPKLEMEESDDFDDPFSELTEEDEEVDESSLKEALEKDEEEILPVITNISSENLSKSEDKKEEPKKEQKTAKEKKKPKKAEPQPAPAWLYALLVVVLIGGGGGAAWYLGYLNGINIPFLSSNSNNSTTTTTVVTPPPAQTQTQPETAPTQSAEASTSISPEEANPSTPPAPSQEQPAEVEVSTIEEVPVPSGNNPEKYGLRGELSPDGNDGFTIVMYSLSNQQNAMSQQQKLTQNGYRAMVAPVQSDRYGQLWRVSIGQFASLYDAAIAAEDIIDELPANYFIKKIN